ncbi:MAG: hypothetical protein J7K80_02535 [Candidatus Izimaplasma sp.]|nr:hypothetical protein [Candidatus Izimaplasma bacterium]
MYYNGYRGLDDRPRRGRRDYGGRNDGSFYRQDRGRGLHLLGGRRDGQGPHLEEGCNTVQNENPGQRFYRNRNFVSNETSKIKMFSSKDDMMKYVNKVGEDGQQVDIFKIEDDLYKVVVYGN